MKAAHLSDIPYPRDASYIWLKSGDRTIRRPAPTTDAEIQTQIDVFLKMYPCQADPNADWRYEQVMRRMFPEKYPSPKKRK